MLKIVKQCDIYAWSDDDKPSSTRTIEVEIEPFVLKQALTNYLDTFKKEMEAKPALAKAMNAEQIVKHIELALYIINARQDGER